MGVAKGAANSREGGGCKEGWEKKLCLSAYGCIRGVAAAHQFSHVANSIVLAANYIDCLPTLATG